MICVLRSDNLLMMRKEHDKEFHFYNAKEIKMHEIAS